MNSYNVLIRFISWKGQSLYFSHYAKDIDLNLGNRSLRTLKLGHEIYWFFGGARDLESRF